MPARTCRVAYDPVGNRTRLTTNRARTRTASSARDLKDDRAYSCDALSRLVSVVEREHQTTRFGYDPVGDRTRVTTNEGEDAPPLTTSSGVDSPRRRRKDEWLVSSGSVQRSPVALGRRPSSTDVLFLQP